MSTSNVPYDPIQDEEIALSIDRLTLYVSPWGASIRGLVSNGIDEIISRYQGAKNKVGGQGDVLIPFPGRIRDGQYKFEGEEYQLVKNDGEGPNAIHGFLRSKPWKTLHQTAQSVTFGIDIGADEHPGYPFSLHTEVTYEISPTGFSVHYSITNIGEKNAPVAAGFHPYFTLGTAVIDDLTLKLPYKSYLVYDGFLPTGATKHVAGSNFDYLEERLIGPVQLNNCFLDPIREPDGNVKISLRTSDAYKYVHVLIGPDIDYVVLYSGDVLAPEHRRKSLAIEPMSCGSDAFNHHHWGLATVKPGEALKGNWSVVYDNALVMSIP